MFSRVLARYLRVLLVLIVTSRRSSRADDHPVDRPPDPQDTRGQVVEFQSMDRAASLTERRVLQQGFAELDQERRHRLTRQKRRRSFTVYDVTHPHAEHRAIDLHAPQACDEIEPIHREPVVMDIQLLMLSSRIPVTAYNCLLTVTKEVSRCGFDSVNYGDHKTVNDEPVQLTPQQCRTAVDKGYLIFAGVKLNITVNSPLNYGYFSHGRLHDDHTCEVESFMSGGRHFDSSYEFTMLRLLVSTVKGWANPHTGRVVFSNQIVANYKDSVCHDDLMGTFVWHTDEWGCLETVSEVYRGHAYVHTHRNNTRAGSRNDLVMIDNSEVSSQVGGFVIKGDSSLCRRGVKDTQIRTMKILFLLPGDTPLQSNNIHHGDLVEAQIQSGFAFVHLNRNMQLDDRFRLLHGLICKNERSNLFNKLAMMADDNSASLLETHGPGHAITRAGAVAYVTTGYPLTATLRAYSNCTQEIPVQVGNRSLFAHPLTMTLQPYPTVVPCDPITPVKWRLNQKWFDVQPTPVDTRDPHQLNPTSDDNLGPLPEFTYGLGEGAYTVEQLTAHREYMEIYGARSGVVAEVTRNALQHADSTGSLNSFYSEWDYKTLKDKIGHALVPFFKYFGESWAIMIGIFSILALIKLFAGMLVRMYVAYLRRGCGLWILGSIWETFFVAVMFPWRMMAAVTAEATTPNPHTSFDPNVNHRRDDPPPPPPPGGGHKAAVLALGAKLRGRSYPEKPASKEDMASQPEAGALLPEPSAPMESISAQEALHHYINLNNETGNPLIGPDGPAPGLPARRDPRYPKEQLPYLRGEMEALGREDASARYRPGFLPPHDPLPSESEAYGVALQKAFALLEGVKKKRDPRTATGRYNDLTERVDGLQQSLDRIEDQVIRPTRSGSTTMVKGQRRVDFENLPSSPTDPEENPVIPGVQGASSLA